MNGPILITGTSGQVGGAILRLLSEAFPQVEVSAPTRTQMNLGDAVSIRDYVRRTRPRWIVSAAAYTAVDAAESDTAAAYAANAEAPGILAEEAAAVGAALIHFSTDYVFNGEGERAWQETDLTDPRNIYGKSKLAGEEAIATTGAPHVILRTSWVYSGGGKNFVRTMLRLLSTRTEPLRIVADQHGAPTSADDLADAAIRIISQVETLVAKEDLSLTGALGSRSGVYHCVAAGETTWAGLAGAVREYISDHHGITPPEIIPVPTAEYPTPAARPLNSRLNCDKLAASFGVRLPLWSDSLPAALRALAVTDMPLP